MFDESIRTLFGCTRHSVELVNAMNVSACASFSAFDSCTLYSVPRSIDALSSCAVQMGGGRVCRSLTGVRRVGEVVQT